MRRALLILLTALPLIGAWVVVPGLGSGGIQGMASASPSAQVPGQIDRVLIDADTTQDGVQTCRSVSVGDSVAVDIILDEIDAADGTLDNGGGGNAGIRYTDAPLDFSDVSGLGPWTDAMFTSGSEEAIDGTKQLVGYTAIAFPADRPEFSGIQPFFRVTFDVVAAGLATINIGNVPGHDDSRDLTVNIGSSATNTFDPFDDNEDGFIIQNRQGAFIAVGEACPQGAPDPFPDEPTTRTLPEAVTPGTPTVPAADTPVEDDDGVTDDDNDAVEDADDLCPGTAPGSEVDEHGCSSTQLPLGGGQPGAGDDGTNWAIVLAIVAPIAALAVAGVAWWRLRRRSAFDRGGE